MSLTMSTLVTINARVFTSLIIPVVIPVIKIITGLVIEHPYFSVSDITRTSMIALSRFGFLIGDISERDETFIVAFHLSLVAITNTVIISQLNVRFIVMEMVALFFTVTITGVPIVLSQTVGLIFGLECCVTLTFCKYSFGSFSCCDD